MVTTYVPPAGPIDPSVTVRDIQDYAQFWLEVAQGDCDKADTVENSIWYDGNVEAYQSVLLYIQGDVVRRPIPNKRWALFTAAAVTYYALAAVHRKDTDV